MTIAESLTKLSTDIGAAYDAVEAKGGTIPTEKNTDNLASAIESMEGGGGGGDNYNIPEFDGGQYGAIAYLDKNNNIAYYTATSSSDLKISDNSTASPGTVVKILDGGYTIRRSNLLGYSFGDAPLAATGSPYFLICCPNLRALYGLERVAWTSVGSNFLYQCKSFNQPITLPPQINTINSEFLAECSAFNQVVTIPTGTKSIQDYFMERCTAFNQPLSIPDTVTTIGAMFLYECSSFNQPLDIPDGVTSLGNSFLQSDYSFNSPLTLPTNLTKIGNNFMQNCQSFNQELRLPETLTSLGTNPLYNAYDFTGPLYIGPTAVLTTANYSFSVGSATCLAYTQGVTLTGPGAAAWKEALPDRTSSPYRKLILAEEAETTE